MRAFLAYCVSAVILVNIGYAALALRHQLAVYNKTREVYEPLSDRIRSFNPGDDATKVYVRCMVERPLDLQWSYSLPPGKNLVMIQQSLAAGSFSMVGTVPTGSNGRYDANCRWAIKADEADSAFFHFGSGSGSSSSGYGEKLARFLRENWDRLDKQIAGREALEALDAEKIITLLRIDVPEEVRQDAPAELGTFWMERLAEPILICIGARDSKEWENLPLNETSREQLGEFQR